MVYSRFYIDCSVKHFFHDFQIPKCYDAPFSNNQAFVSLSFSLHFELFRHFMHTQAALVPDALL